jgi:hypothetical protein
MEVQLCIMDGSEWSASHFGNFTTAASSPATHWVKGCWRVCTVFLQDGRAEMLPSGITTKITVPTAVQDIV